MPTSTTTIAPANWLMRLLPAFDSLRTYTAAAARADLLAGLTVAAVAVPQAMGYAMIIGLPPEYGLYTAIVMTVVGAVFASSRQLINGPTNAISIAVLSAVGTLAAPENLIGTVMLLTFMVGVVQLGISLFRLGDLTRYISNSVIVGFTLGASSLLVVDQMKNLLGMKAMGGAHDHVLYRFWLTMVDGGGVHLTTAAVGFGTIALIVALRWLKLRLRWALLPDLFLVVCAMAALSAGMGLESHGVKIVGDIPADLPYFQLPHFDTGLMRELSTGALAIALLGLLEAISMSKALAAQTKQRLDMNQQCLSEGLANLAGSFFQCIPGSGSLTRSAINHQAGAVTQWAGVVSAVGVAVIMVLVAPYLRHLPRSALAGMLLVASFGMVDWHALRYHLKATRFDAAIVMTTAFCALAISVEFCVLLGVLMSFMLTVPRAGRMLLTEFVVSSEHGHVHERLPEDRGCDRILIYGLEGELFFGATGALERHFETMEAAVTGNTRVIVLRLKRARNPDAVALTLLEHFLDRMKARNVHVLMCGVTPWLYSVLKNTGMIHRFGEQVFREERVRQTSTMRAVQHAYSMIAEPCPICPESWYGMAMHTDPAHQQASRLDRDYRPWQIRIFSATWLAYAGYYFCRKPFYVVKADMATALGLSITDIAHLGTVYLAAYAIGQFSSAGFGRLLGPKLLLVLGIGISVACNAVFGIANGFWTLLLFLAINGLAQGTGWPGCIGSLAFWFRRRQRGSVLGVWSTCYQIGSLAATAFAAYLLGQAGWRWSFFGSALLLLGIWAIVLIVHPGRPEDVGLAPLVDNGDEEGENPGPMDKDKSSGLGWNRDVVVSVMTIGVIYFTIKFLRYALWSWAPFFLRQNFGLAGDQAGYLSTVFELCGFAGVIAAGFVSDRLFGGRRAFVALVMLAAMTLSFLLMATLGASSVFYFTLSMGLAGFMLFGPDSLLSGAGAIDVGSRRGALAAAGIINGMGSIGPIFQEEIIGWMYQVSGNHIDSILMMLVGVAAVGTFVTLLLWQRARQGRSTI